MITSRDSVTILAARILAAFEPGSSLSGQDIASAIGKGAPPYALLAAMEELDILYCDNGLYSLVYVPQVAAGPAADDNLIPY